LLFFALVLAGRRGHVYALDAETGDQIWSFETGGAVYSSPAVVDEVLYVGAMDSNVYAFGSPVQSGLDIPILYLGVGIIAIIFVIVAIVLLRKQK
jgi:hypothetical protein